jgi:hypothetical protein
MEKAMTENNEAIVLRDQEGHYYVVPTQVLAEARMPDDARATVDEDLGETTGFAVDIFQLLGSITPSNERVQGLYGVNQAAWPDFAKEQ